MRRPRAGEGWRVARSARRSDTAPAPKPFPPPERDALQRALLAWFDPSRRPLALRRDRSPYRVLVAEVMSQQTRAQVVAPHLERFLQRFPTVERLAAASDEEVLSAWQGLGYYRRAIHLRAAAITLARRYAGEVPSDPQALRSLPGVGPYVAGAVASLAFGRDEPAIDANGARVLARLFDLRLAVDSPDGRRALERLARGALPPGRAADWNEALMDLGALVCVAGTPRCALCPLAASCRSRRVGDPSRLPLRRPPRAAPEVSVVALVVWAGGRLALRRRPERGLLGGMWEFPVWEGGTSLAAAASAFGLTLRAAHALPPFRHVFTHRVWRVHGFIARLLGPPAPAGDGGAAASLRWVMPEEVWAFPLSGPAVRVAAGARLPRANT